jgi:hypothetical protein
MWPASWGGLRSNGAVAAQTRGAAVTNTIAVWIGLILLAGIIADFAFNGGVALTFLARKFLDLVEWVDFWN